MSAWHRPDVETAALEYLTRAVGDAAGARQIVDGLLARGRAQGVAALVAEVERLTARVAELELQRPAQPRHDFVCFAEDIEGGGR